MQRPPCAGIIAVIAFLAITPGEHRGQCLSHNMCFTCDTCMCIMRCKVLIDAIAV